ncbi:MAG: flagellar protein FlgN [Pseudomonadota bacterium]
MSTATAHLCLDTLEAALQAERHALIAHDIQGLMAANSDKLAALQALESDPPPAALQARVLALSELNRANGALLARRRREVNWALRYLGRLEAADAGYDARGQRHIAPLGRTLASA